jgi:hypothetical protein
MFLRRREMQLVNAGQSGLRMTDFDLDAIEEFEDQLDLSADDLETKYVLTTMVTR